METTQKQFCDKMLDICIEYSNWMLKDSKFGLGDEKSQDPNSLHLLLEMTKGMSKSNKMKFVINENLLLIEEMIGILKDVKAELQNC